MNIRKTINYYLGPVTWAVFGYGNYIKKAFRLRHDYELDLKDPKTFSEKIQWIKIYGHTERLSKYVDKYQVREFVRAKIGEAVLVPLIGVYQKAKDIDFRSLPDSFVIKATHGSGWVVIANDKNNLDWDAARVEIDQWLKSNFYRIAGEPSYRALKGRLVIENCIKDPSGDLKDYRFFCFHGRPVYVAVDGHKYTGYKRKTCNRDIYDVQWNKLPLKIVYENWPDPVARPNKLNNMLEICRNLSEDFPFVRVDLYFTEGRIYFGELTFTPFSGMKPFTPVQYDRIFGEHLDLSRYCGY
jgi:hypothetical protein